MIRVPDPTSALIAPGDLSRVDALIAKGRDAMVLMMGCAAMLVVAGIIEGFVSPAPISPTWKLSVSAISAVLLTVYLLKRDRRITRASLEASGKSL